MAATSKDGPELHSATVELARGRNYGAITTVLPSGRLQTHPIWVGTDGERLVVNTETHRQKYKNVERDPNVTLTIRDEENPYRYAEVRGEVVEKVGAKKPGTTSTSSRRSTTAKITRPIASRASG